MKTVYLNGKYTPLSEAKVSVLDRGFLFGDGVYEVLPVYNNSFFHLDDHLVRLENSLNNINLSLPISKLELTAILETVLEKNQQLGSRQYLYLQVTRGQDTQRKHDINPDTKPTIFIEPYQLAKHEKNDLAKGYKAITTDDIRWQLCHIKSISLLSNVLLNQQAKRQDANEAILVRDGVITEGATSNIFTVKNGIISTPPLSHHLLGGITRQFILELAIQNNIPLDEKILTEGELKSADEVWITSTTRELFPITFVDDTQIGDGKAGPLWARMFDLFQDYTNSI